MNGVYQPGPPRRAWIFRPIVALHGLTPFGLVLAMLVGGFLILYGVAGAWVLDAICHPLGRG